ncbi:MAG: hypothetical protein ABR538_05170 [Candidatus Binatia bacterium]
MVVGTDHHFEAVGVKRKHWSSAAPIRAMFREAFEAAGLPYFNPDSLRSTLVQLGEATCHTPEDFKAWSQNLGHEGVMTTFYSYGQVGTRRQGEVIQGLGALRPSSHAGVEEIAEAVVRRLGGSSPRR